MAKLYELAGVAGRAVARSLLTLTIAAGLESAFGGREFNDSFNDSKTRTFACAYAAGAALAELKDKKERKYGN